MIQQLVRRGIPQTTKSCGTEHPIIVHDHAMYARARERTMEMRAAGIRNIRASPDLWHMLVGCCTNVDFRVVRLVCAPDLPPNSLVAV